MSLPYSYESQGRRPVTVLTLMIIWLCIAVAYLWLEASPVIMGAIGAFTLPALYDLIVNPKSTFKLDAEHLHWCTPRQKAEIAVSEIDHLRFDTRLDMSVRLTVVRPSGVKIRVPFPATPPHATLEPLAVQAGIKTQRHHFSLLG